MTSRVQFKYKFKGNDTVYRYEEETISNILYIFGAIKTAIAGEGLELEYFKIKDIEGKVVSLRV